MGIEPTHPLPQERRDFWLPVIDPAPAADADTRERILYRTHFRVPEQWNVRTLLRFGAVDWRATVLLDGRELGGHEGGYTHFTFDAGHLEPGSEHELVVDVFDPLDDAFGQAKGKQRGSHDIWYTRTIGAWRSVWIEGVPDEYIHDPGAMREAVEIESPRPWSPDDPFLYDVDLRLGDDVVHTYVGFRTIERCGRELLLNGEPLRIAGVLDQGFWPDGVYVPPSDDALRADVASAKAMGFNLARKHVKVEDPRWYAWCDRLGLLVAQDMPSSHDLSTEVARERFAAEWREVVAQLRGHPSIVMWIPINEDWGRPPPDFQKRLVAETRATDPTRLVVDASGWNQLDDTDLVDVHDYGATLTKHRGVRDDLPLWFGELGGFNDYRAVVEQVPRDAAGFVWTQLTDVEQEQNGLLTYDRRPKVDLDEIRRINEEFLRA